MGYATVIFMNFCNGTVQLNSSEEFRMRAISVYTLIFTGTTPLGNFMTGHITELFGIKMSLMIAGISTIGLLVALRKILKI